MAYIALYNKYRPQSFEEVAGQQVIVRTLSNAIRSEKIAHAYLFCGPRGTGKTSMARLFAKALNCEEGIGHQCNHCGNCLALNEGSHPDVIEIDAASNNGVDQVRELIERVAYLPIRGRYKVYIIDEVHMMSAGAFNALLKTLEEPPEHVVFILATTEPHKVLPTIVSRCQRYDFAKIEDKEIKSRLVDVLGKEHVRYEEGGLNAIVELADGGMRDALSILDQVLAYGGNELKEGDVLSVFGLASVKEKVELLEKISNGDIPGVLAKLNQFLDAGIDIKRLNASLLEVLKDVLVYARTKDESLLSQLKADSAKKLGQTISVKKANQMIEVFLQAQINFKTVSNIRSLFELTLLQLTSLSESAPKVEEAKSEPEAAPAPVKPAAEEKPAKMEEKPAKAAPMPKIEEEEEEIGLYTGDVPPAFLFEDEKKPEPAPVVEEKKPEPEPVVEEKKEVPPPPAPAVPKIDKSKLHFRKMAIEGDSYELPDDTIIGIIALGPKFKAERTELVNKWPAFDQMRLDPDVGEAASLLAQAQPFCLCKEALLIRFNFKNLSTKANIKANQLVLSELVAALLGRKVFIYGLDGAEASRIRYLYSNLQQVHKLPNPNDVVLNLPKEAK